MDSPCGLEGKYRRTSSPATPGNNAHAHTPPGRKASAPPAANGVSSMVGAAMMADKSPAKTPKRESPATIAAKGNKQRNV